MDYMNEQASQNIQNMNNAAEDLENQKIDPSVNPYSNGTGSGRSVFDPMAQNSINNVNQGQTMGNVMFKNQNQQVDPTMQNQGPSISIASGGKGSAGSLLGKIMPLAATAATVIGASKLIGGGGKNKKEEASVSSGENPSREVDKPKKGLFKKK